MRPRIYNILLLLAGMLLAVAATTSCVYNTPGGDEELTLLIKFSPTHPFRTIEQGAANDSYTVDTYKPIALFFYDAAGNPTEPYRVELKSDEDIAQAMGTGYKIKVRQAVRKVSAVAGRDGVLKPADLGDLLIYELQTLGGADNTTKSFLHSVPYVAPQAEVQEVAADPNKLTVELQPVPNVARLEISGNITIPQESQKTLADEIVTKRMKTYPNEGYSYVASPCELPIRYITDFTVRGIYINNYKEKVGAANEERIFLDSAKYDLTNKVWTGHNAAMHTFFVATNPYASQIAAGKVDAYQIYPGSAANPEALDHVIVEVEYKLHTRVGYFDAMVYNKDKSDYVYACSRVEEKPVQTLRRFITIRKFLVTKGTTDESLVAFDPGKIYRIDLKYLNPLFSMNVKPGVITIDDSTKITPGRERTDERPEETSAAVRVDVSGWTHININTELE
ncbi:hypothetical protein [uncultured Porphyromonas sp.]|uniref:hypothetical protein n=1 Tax=uncultured Porphyromonas sp. TaxID=159274 RepID=UPI002629526C|nr:hypothetical protein [uncultured Porphyromonas sp.]